MATKKIIASITLHRPAKDFTPFEFDALGARTKGDYKVTEVAPGTTAEIDTDEADSLIARDLAVEAPKVTKSAEQPTA